MNVSELARGAGLSPSGVRWYEAVGVLPAAPRRRNGYREYSKADLRLLQLVTTLRRVGLTPADAGRLARLCLEHGAIDGHVLSTLSEHRRAISRQRQELDRLEQELADLEATVSATSHADWHTNVEAAAEAQAPISVLFVCNGNSGRSQLAEALLQLHGGVAFEARSAGISPRGIGELAIRALAEAGIDWSGARSKHIDEFADRRFAYVITLSDSAREQCPALPGPHNSLHWHLEDPADATGTEAVRLQAYRRTLEELMLRLRPFIELAAQTVNRTRLIQKEKVHG
jgi:protein-tyrosine-phosphatase